MMEHLIQAAYVVATALFVFSLKWLSDPDSARRGVMAGVLGMTAAIVGTLLNQGIVSYTWIATAFVLGTVVGVPLSRVALTAVPQRTAPSHAFRGQPVATFGPAQSSLNSAACRPAAA